MSYDWNEMKKDERNKLIWIKVMDGKMPKLPYITVNFPRYSTEISAAWEVFQNMKGRLFTQRMLFMRHLQIVVSKRSELNSGSLINWPDALWFVKPEDICLAALLTLDVDIVY